jgi:hypothetical protein
MKGPLRGTRDNTREIIHAVGRLPLDINRSGRADGVRLLPQIWQKVVHTGGGAIIMKESEFTSGDKSFKNYRGVATTFYGTFFYFLNVRSPPVFYPLLSPYLLSPL